MKKCSKCKRNLKLEYFYKDIQKKDRLTTSCKNCINKRVEDYKNKNKKWYIEYHKNYNRSEKELLRKKKWKQNHPEYDKEYRIKNRDKFNNYMTNYRIEYSKKNIEKIRAYRNKYFQEKRKDPCFKLRDNLNRRLNKALKQQNILKNNTRIIDIIGCTIESFKKYLESKFLPGMSWDNRNMWQIDHIIPCAFFDFNDEKQIVKCFHFTNLQPLWKKDNQKKGSLYNGKRY